MYKVAQCWDDGVENDIIVAEICRKYNAKATFNINPGLNAKSIRLSGWIYDNFGVDRLSLDEMPAVYEGFTVASHTMTHPWPSKLSREEFRREALDARKYIEDVWQRSAPGFAWPYGDVTPEGIEVLREEKFVYGRSIVNVPHILPCKEPLDAASNCHFLNPDIEAIRREAAASGAFYFWGHSYEMKDDKKLIANYEKLIRTISEDPEAQWVDVSDLFA